MICSVDDPGYPPHITKYYFTEGTVPKESTDDEFDIKAPDNIGSTKVSCAAYNFKASFDSEKATVYFEGNIYI